MDFDLTRLAGAPADLPPGRLRVIVTYLRMPAPTGRRPGPRPLPDLHIARVDRPSVAFYRHLYDTVGEPWLWTDRRRMTDSDLAAILGEPLVEVIVLRRGDALAGFVELDRRPIDSVDVAYFGLFPDCTGRGLGSWFLDEAIELAWSSGPSTLTVNTCTFDHPAALPLYRSRGFQPVDHVVRLVDDPRLTGLLPRDAAPHIPLARR